MIAFDLERRLSAAHDVVKENGLLDGGDERVADASEHRVVRPYHEGVLTVLAEAPAILLQIFLVAARNRFGRPRAHRPPAGGDVVECYHRHRLGVLPGRVDEKGAMEDLHRFVGVERGMDARDAIEILVDESTKPFVVLDSGHPRSPRNKELEFRNAKCVLDVHEQKPDTIRVT